MTDEKEKIEEPVQSGDDNANEDIKEEPVEEVKEEEVKEPEAEVKAEEPAEEVLEAEKEPVAEEPKEPEAEPAEVVAVEDNVKKIEEQLSVISEVRTELANSYATQKENAKLIEQLQSQIKSIEGNFVDATKTIEKLSNELDSYKAREVEANSIAYNKRLEQLSSKFGELGQNKTVEQLRELPEDVISEFESVTSMALNHKSEEKLDAVTTPTQAIPQYRVVQKVPEKLSDKDFMKGVLNTLARQQNTQGADGKRILTM